MRNKLFIMVFVFILLNISLSSAWNQNTFLNGSIITSENLSFINNQNITRNLSIPSSVGYITKVFLNISGYPNNTNIYNDDFNDGAMDWTNWRNKSSPTNGCGGDSYTYSETSGYQEAKAGVSVSGCGSTTIATAMMKFIRNLTDKNYEIKTNITTANSISTGSVAMRLEAYNDANNTLTLVNLPISDNLEFRILSNNSHFLIYYKNNTFISDVDASSLGSVIQFGMTSVVTCGGFQCIGGTYSMVRMNNFTTTNMSNNFLKVGTPSGSYDWSYIGVFDHLNNKTNNLYNSVNSYLSSCVLENNYCLVPFIFGSNTNSFIGYSDLLFSNEGFKENSQYYNQNATIFSTESFGLNISYDSSYYSSLTGTLVYNNTRYVATKTSNGNNVSFMSTVIIPLVQTQTNKTFYWEILLANATSINYYNSSNNNQSINSILLDDCSVYNNLIINYTVFDEEIRNKLTSPVYNVSAYYNILIGDVNLNNYISSSFNKTGVNGIKICSQNLITASLRLDASIRYSANSYAVEYYNIQNYTLNSLTDNYEISLYDLLLTDSQEFLITVKDDNLLPIRDALVRIDRQYLSLDAFLPIEQPKTDNDGRTIVHLVLSDEVYNIYVIKNGQILATFNNVRAYCDNAVIGDCKINLKTSSSSIRLDSYDTNDGVVYSTDYNQTSRIYTITFNVISGESKTIGLNIVGWNARLNNTICTNSITSSSGSLLCSIPDSFGNGTAQATISINSVIFGTQIFNIGGNDTTTLKVSRFFFAFLLVLILPLMALGSPYIIIIVFILGFIISGMFLFISADVFGVVAPLGWLIVAGGILLWKLQQIDSR